MCDAEAPTNYFYSCNGEIQIFFPLIDMGEESHLANEVWVDARFIVVYKTFADVTSFNIIYLTRKYDMPFVPIAKVDHHAQIILFGCDLLLK